MTIERFDMTIEGTKGNGKKYKTPILPSNNGIIMPIILTPEVTFLIRAHPWWAINTKAPIIKKGKPKLNILKYSKASKTAINTSTIPLILLISIGIW